MNRKIQFVVIVEGRLDYLPMSRSAAYQLARRLRTLGITDVNVKPLYKILGSTLNNIPIR